MMFRGKYDRARALQKEQMQGRDLAYDDENLAEKLEKNDTLAMILAALITFIPAAVIGLGLMILAGWFFFFR